MTKPLISIIAAYSKNYVIGKNNSLPWHLSEDLKRFKKITLHKVVIMGRNTFESIGKALPKRHNIVVTRQPTLHTAGIHCQPSLQAAISYAQTFNTEIVIIGGARLYQEALPYAQRLYLTELDQEVDGDVFFPPWDKSQWQLREHQTFSAPCENLSGAFNVYECE